jgi:F-type H+-transporting ATPase subunit b
MFVAPAFAQESNEAHDLRTELEIDIHEEPVFPPFDSTTFASQLVWLAITFGLFYLFLKRVILPRIGGIIEVRNSRIAQDLDQAARLKEEADAVIAAYEQELADAKARANAIGQQARDGAKAEAEAERKQTEASLDAKLSEAEARIALIKDAAMRDVGTIAEETASAIVQELIGARADKPAVAAAVQAARR